MKKHIKVVFLHLLLIIFFGLSSCFGTNNKDTKSIKQNDSISLKFINVPPVKNTKKIDSNTVRTFNSPYIAYSTNKNFFLEEIGVKDSIDVKIKEDTIYLRLRYDFDKFETLTFFNGDSILIDYVNNIPKVKILNRAAKKYDYNLIELFNDHEKPLNNGFIKKLDQRELKDHNDKLIRVLDSIKKIDLISDELFQFRKKQIYYSTVKNKERLKLIVKDSNDLNIDTFKGLLINYSMSLIKPRIIERPGSGYIFNSKKAFDFVVESDLFNNQNKEFLLWNFLKGIGNNFSKKDFENRYKVFIKKTNNEKLIDDIRNEFFIYNANGNKKTNDVLFINAEKERINLNEIVQKYRGKLIYIDFWASWCAPCRSAIPASRKLKTEFKNREVVFIYVSIDKNLKAWKKASEDEGLSFYKNNILAVNYPNANFYKELDLKTIPRYILYDKNGKLIHQNAPGPEGEEIRKLFDKYLDE